MPSDWEALGSCLVGVPSAVSSMLVRLRCSLAGSLELEDLGGVSAGVKSEVLGLTGVSVAGFQDEGDTECLAAFLSLGIIRAERQGHELGRS